MPLLSSNEITVEALMADVAMQRSARNQLQLQLITLQEGLALESNPLERSGVVRQHIVGENETLQIISNRLFGVPSYWQAIAQANNLQYPYTVAIGQVLTIPEINRDTP